MKKIEAVINHRVFQPIRDLLVGNGHELVVSEVASADQSGGRTLRYRGVAYSGDELRLKIEIVVSDSEAIPVAHAILSLAHELDSTDHTVSLSHLESVLSIGISKLGPGPATTNAQIPPRPHPAQHARHILIF
jgi:nitrogen regulatory protein PII